MINFIGCLTVYVIALLLSEVKYISVREAKIITIIGWILAIYSAKGGRN